MSNPESKFRKILIENSIIIEHKINKLKLQMIEAQHKNQQESIELILKIATMFWNAFRLFFNISFFLIISYFRW